MCWSAARLRKTPLVTDHCIDVSIDIFPRGSKHTHTVTKHMSFTEERRRWPKSLAAPISPSSTKGNNIAELLMVIILKKYEALLTLRRHKKTRSHQHKKNIQVTKAATPTSTPTVYLVAYEGLHPHPVRLRLLSSSDNASICRTSFTSKFDCVHGCADCKRRWSEYLFIVRLWQVPLHCSRSTVGAGWSLNQRIRAHMLLQCEITEYDQ